MMADITKCSNCKKYCKDYKNCYRYTAKDSYWQSYAEFHHGEKTDSKKCKNFIRSKWV